MTKRKTLVSVDIIKQQHTSHWDDDMLSRNELEWLYTEGRRRRRLYERRQFAWIAFWLALLCLHPTVIYWVSRWVGA